MQLDTYAEPLGNVADIELHAQTLVNISLILQTVSIQ